MSFTLSRRTRLSLLVASSLFAPKALAAQPPTNPPAVRPDLPPALRKAAEQFQRALDLHRVRKIPEAIAAYKEFLRLAEAAKMPNADRASACLNLLQLYAAKQDAKGYDETMALLLRLDPPQVEAQSQLATWLARKNRGAEATTWARKALAQNPPPPVAAPCWFVVGGVALQKNDYPAAEKAYANAARLVPENPLAQFNYGVALARQRKFKQAIPVVEKAAKLAPKMVEPLTLLAGIKQDQKDYAGALAVCEQALKIDPNNAAALFGRATLLNLLGRKTQAIIAYSRALERYPQNGSVQLDLAQLYYSIQNYAAAYNHYAAAAKLLPKDYRPWFGMALCRMEEAGRIADIPLRKKTFDQSEANFKKAVELAPKERTLQFALGQFYERASRFDEALALYQKRMQANPDDVTHYQGAGRVHLMKREIDASVAVWKKYRQRRPEDPLSYLEAARALELGGRWDEANKEYEALLKRQPKDGSVMLTVARNLTQLRKTDEARRQYEAVLALDPNGKDLPNAPSAAVAAAAAFSHRLDALRGLATLEQSENRWEQALPWWRKAKQFVAERAEKTKTLPDLTVYRAYAYACEQAKQFGEAVQVYEEMALADPKDSLAYSELGRLYDQQNKLPEAIGAYRNAARRATDPLETLLQIPNLYRKRSQFANAVAEYENLMPEYSKEARLLNPLAQTYEQAGMDDKALATYEALRRVDATATWIDGRKATILTRLKRYPEALTLYERALEKNPEDYLAYADLARIYKEQGREDAYLKWLEQRMETKPLSPALMAHLLDSYQLQKREAEGWNYLKTFVEKRKTQRGVLETYAGLLNQRGKRNEATEVVRQLATLSPKDLNAQLSLVEQLDFADQRDEATKTLEALAKRTDWDAEGKRGLRRRLADRYMQTGRQAEAIPLYAEALKDNPNDLTAATTLAQAYLAANREADAIPIYVNLAGQKAYAPEVRAQIRVKLGGIYEKRGSKTDAVGQYREALRLNPKDKEAAEGVKRLE